MIPPIKAQLLGMFAKACQLAPFLRVGQLIHWVRFSGGDRWSAPLPDLADEAFLELAYGRHDVMAARLDERGIHKSYRSLSLEELPSAGKERAAWVDRSAPLTPEATVALEVVGQICERAPNLSFGRVMCLLGESLCQRGLPDLEDDELLFVARQHLETMNRNREAVDQSARRHAEAVEFLRAFRAGFAPSDPLHPASSPVSEPHPHS